MNKIATAATTISDTSSKLYAVRVSVLVLSQVEAQFTSKPVQSKVALPRICTPTPNMMAMPIKAAARPITVDDPPSAMSRIKE